MNLLSSNQLQPPSPSHPISINMDSSEPNVVPPPQPENEQQPDQQNKKKWRGREARNGQTGCIVGMGDV